MKSGFVQLVIKRRLQGKKLIEPTSRKRFQPIDSFKKYISGVVPIMEQAVQIQLLKENLKKINNKNVRKQLINAYLRRLFRLRVYDQQFIKGYKEIKPIDSQLIKTIIDPTILKAVNEHSEYDIGSYIIFNNQWMKQVFKHGCCGEYMSQQYNLTKKFGIMIREECIGIGQVMKLMQLNKDKKIEWNTLVTLPSDELQAYINNQKNYPVLFTKLSAQLYSRVQKYRSQQKYMRIWGSSIISDGIVHSILQNMPKNSQDPLLLLQSAIDYIVNLQIAVSPADFHIRFKQLPLQSCTVSVATKPPYYSSFYYNTPSFKCVFLGGQDGTGRSMIINYLAMLAHHQQWIILLVPSMYKWTNQPKATYTRYYNGLYLIHEHAVQWLDHFKQTNFSLIEKMSIKKDIYGFCDITGVHQSEYDPVPNYYDVDRQFYAHEISNKFGQRIQQVEKKQRSMRITDILPSPNNLLEIASIGVSNPEYATCAMGQILQQLYNSEEMIIQLVDGISFCYRPSGFRSFRYFNDRGLFGAIPPYHLAHCRLFMNVDGHKIKNGIKVVAASNYPLYKHKFNIKQIMLPKQYQHKVQELTPQQFQKVGNFSILTNWWTADDILRSNMEYAYTLSQGNWKDFNSVIKLAHYY